MELKVKILLSFYPCPIKRANGWSVNASHTASHAHTHLLATLQLNVELKKIIMLTNDTSRYACKH